MAYLPHSPSNLISCNETSSLDSVVASINDYILSVISDSEAWILLKQKCITLLRIDEENTNNAFGAFLTRNYNIFSRSAFDLPLRLGTDREVVDVDDEVANVEMISDDTTMECDFVDKVAMEVDDVEEKVERENGFCCEPFNLKNGNLMVDDGSQANQKSSLVWFRPVTDVSSFEAYRKVLESAKNRNLKAKARGFGGILKERWYALLRTLGFSWKQDEEPVEVWLLTLIFIVMA